MKNNQIKGFALGAVSACLVMGVAYSTVDAARNITVQDGIRIQMNNTAFVPKDAKGNPVSPFLYNGTTYVPMRPLCEAIGMTVSYDAKTKTVSLTAPNANTTPNTSATPNTGTTPNVGDTTGGTGTGTPITDENAKIAALGDAGISVSDAKFQKCELKQDNGKSIYEIEFTAGGKKYEYQVDATTSAIVKKDSKEDSGSSAKLSESEAKDIAAKKAGVSSPKFEKCELKQENGKSVYEIEFTSDSTKYEYKIDANDGSVISSDKEDEKK